MEAFRIVPGFFGPKVRGKLGKMRKERDFSIAPRSDGLVMVTGENVIGTFDPATGKGVLNTKGGYFVHLSSALGARPFEYPADFVALAMEVMPEPGETTTRGGVTIEHTVRVI